MIHKIFPVVVGHFGWCLSFLTSGHHRTSFSGVSIFPEILQPKSGPKASPRSPKAQLKQVEKVTVSPLSQGNMLTSVRGEGGT